MGNSESSVDHCTAPLYPVQQNQGIEIMNDSSEIPAAKENRENGGAPPQLKELVIESGGVPGFVEVAPTDTLSNVRSLIMDEFDDDMIPDEGDFYFCVNGIRMSAKQEARKNAWDLQENHRVSIHSKRKKLKMEEETLVEESVLAEERQLGEKPAAEEESADKLANDSMDTGAPGEESQPKTVEEHAPTEETHPVAGSEAQSPKTAEAITAATTNGDGNESQPATAESTATATPHVESARRLLNFNGQFPYDRHNREGEEESVATEDFPASTKTTSESIDDAPMDVDTPAVSEASKETEEEPMTEVAASLKDDSPAPEADMEDVFTVAEEDTTDVIMSSEQDDDDKDEDDDIEEVKQAEDPHKIHDEALKSSCNVLNEMKTLLNDNPLFCSEDRRKDWTSEITESLAKSAPNVVIGVLGNTGVGKSSLLNALLEEASVLPTSGSRGCTAAVVELRFNKDLKDATAEVPVYKGEVEFITLKEWAMELKILIEECSTAEEKTIYARRPEEERQPGAAAAWAKIDQVYGRGTMERFTTWKAAQVYDRLINDQRVKNLLTPQQGSMKPHNSILIEEGKVNPEEAGVLFKGFSKVGTRLRRTKKKWAQKFRSKINDYVYRKGNGNLPQTWPLIRKVVLEGPWAALNSGACLVDLPGVRDANAARAKVSESYLMNCSQIWVVAPIKRAVDDGTAKELLGEQFKRRLLMDGQVSSEYPRSASQICILLIFSRSSAIVAVW